jgi:hypothetical protein
LAAADGPGDDFQIVPIGINRCGEFEDVGNQPLTLEENRPPLSGQSIRQGPHGFGIGSGTYLLYFSTNGEVNPVIAPR